MRCTNLHIYNDVVSWPRVVTQNRGCLSWIYCVLLSCLSLHFFSVMPFCLNSVTLLHHWMEFSLAGAELCDRFACRCYWLTAELYLSSSKFDSAYACIQEAASYNPVSHVVSYMVCTHYIASPLHPWLASVWKFIILLTIPTFAPTFLDVLQSSINQLFYSSPKSWPESWPT